ncbi:MAG TPA: hypothetical protein VFH59_13125 [Frateuria sp.]|uniref:hypothetical protein n=1 Tax=Frateuria sp. TaxID=2211372 RepID=UPI002D7F27DA|nr:hypothetical protein [Frateuria sp.]HET6806372.1 hypothetical protein [Frateuria sp.]
MKIRAGSIATLVALLCTGCQPTMTNKGTFTAYSSGQLVGDAPATLKLGQDYGLSIFKLDGQSVGCKKFLLRCPAEIRMLPGKHEVVLRFMNRLGQRADVCVWLTAKPGGVYLAKFVRPEHDTLRTWIEDQHAVHVGGICGSYDEPLG